MKRVALLLAVFALVALSSASRTGRDEPLPRKGSFGAMLSMVTSEARKAMKLPFEGGLLVNSVIPGTTAEGGGVKPKDILIELSGEPIAAVQQFFDSMARVEIGEAFEVKVWRGGETLKLPMKLKEKPRDKGDGYDVLYDEVTSQGERLRTIVTKPSGFTGKRPAVLLIQGVGYFSVDQPLTGPGAYSRLLKNLSDQGFVTIRVEKPGMGDSEGGPLSGIEYETEVDAFRQGLKSIKKYDFIDPDRLFVFGHAMGGCEASIVAAEMPVRGLAVYGTVARTWQEYMIQNVRRQSMLGGEEAAQMDTEMKQVVGLFHFIFNEHKDVSEVGAEHPEMQSVIKDLFPDGKTMSGISLNYWRGCFDMNFGEQWGKVNAKVLSLWGESDFIGDCPDAELVAQIVNKKHAGAAKFMAVPGVDHGFFRATSMEESFKHWGKPGNEINPDLIEIITKWMSELAKK